MTEYCVNIGGHNFTLASDDEYLRAHGGVFEPETVHLFRSLASGTNTALDVGANVGCTALLLSQLAERVHAFEPSPTTYDWLCRNTRDASNITTHNVGLGAQAGISEITFAPNNRSGGFVSDQTQASAGHVVETIQVQRLDDIARTKAFDRVDFIKIDVEGYEMQVLRGAAETLWRYKPTIALEMNHWCLNAFHRISVPEFIEFLTTAFPCAHAVHAGKRLDLHNPDDRYVAMHHHILHSQYNSVVCSYDVTRISEFLATYPNAR